ncbi:unnamed protein product [Pylaiella littoralis]
MKKGPAPPSSPADGEKIRRNELEGVVVHNNDGADESLSGSVAVDDGQVQA